MEFPTDDNYFKNIDTKGKMIDLVIPIDLINSEKTIKTNRNTDMNEKDFFENGPTQNSQDIKDCNANFQRYNSLKKCGKMGNFTGMGNCKENFETKYNKILAKYKPEDCIRLKPFISANINSFNDVLQDYIIDTLITTNQHQSFYPKYVQDDNKVNLTLQVLNAKTKYQDMSIILKYIFSGRKSDGLKDYLNEVSPLKTEYEINHFFINRLRPLDKYTSTVHLIPYSKAGVLKTTGYKVKIYVKSTLNQQKTTEIPETSINNNGGKKSRRKYTRKGGKKSKKSTKKSRAY
jgi:hypothetical protein